MHFVQNFQKTRKKGTPHTRKLRILENNNMSIVRCEILNKIAKQLLKMLNKCILFVSS